MLDRTLPTIHYTISQVHEFVHVAWSDHFAMSLLTLMPMWRDVLRFCRERRLQRVLIEGRAPIRDMRPIDAFRHGCYLSTLEAPSLRIAFCLYEFEPDVVTWLFARTANEGPCSVEFFRELDPSLRWLGA